MMALSPQHILILVLVIYIGFFCFDILLDALNLSALQTSPPKELSDIYEADKYKKSQEYLKENTVFSWIKSSVSFVLMLSLIFYGGFNWIDIWVRSFGYGEILSGVIYFFVLIIASLLLGIPASLYKTFVIEEKYGFNKTTPFTFFTDLIKSLLLSIIIGFPLIYGMLWFFETFTTWSWFYCWIFVSVFQLVLMVLAPVVIMPLFNKFEPLEDGELKDKILDYAKKETFALSGLFKMDGSKRSSKSNAYFTGFGKFRRIVLFDTLIENQSADELLVVVAHEMGHYKKKHIYKMVIISTLTSFVMFYLLSLLMKNPELFEAFKMQHISVYASLIFFGFLYKPVSFILSIFMTLMSRKHEYEADEYAVKTTGLYDELCSGLKKLSKDNLSNLTPHKAKVFFEYSHPPLLERIKAIQKLKG